MRFLVDMPLSPGLVRWLGERGHDAVHASTVGLGRSPNLVVLQHASDEDRILITADLDYGRLLFLARTHARGVILLRGGTYNDREAIHILGKVRDSVPGPELPRCLVVADPGRIRKRRLPLTSS